MPRAFVLVGRRTHSCSKGATKYIHVARNHHSAFVSTSAQYKYLFSASENARMRTTRKDAKSAVSGLIRQRTSVH